MVPAGSSSWRLVVGEGRRLLGGSVREEVPKKDWG